MHLFARYADKLDQSTYILIVIKNDSSKTQLRVQPYSCPNSQSLMVDLKSLNKTSVQTFWS